MRTFHKNDPFYGLVDLTSLKIDDTLEIEGVKTTITAKGEPPNKIFGKLYFSSIDENNTTYQFTFAENSFLFSETRGRCVNLTDITTENSIEKEIVELMFNSFLEITTNEEESKIESYFNNRYNKFEQTQS